MISLDKWRSLAWQPAPTDRKREELFLEQRLESGCRIHTITASALETDLSEETSAEKRHVLYLRLFAEYVNALEELGAWGWAIRNRARFALLLDAYLGYGPSDVRGFYRCVTKHHGDLGELLELPPAKVIANRFGAGGIPRKTLLEELDLCLANIKQAAKHYADPDEVFVSNYNKAKHGAPLIRTSDLGADEFYVLAPQRDPTILSRYTFSKFRADPALVEHTVKLIAFVTNTTVALTSLTRNLRNGGLI